MPIYYPLHLDVADRLCVVVGGGPVAERKIKGLLESGAKVRVVSLSVTPEIGILADKGVIELIVAPYHKMYLEGASLAFAVTNRADVNAQAGKDAGDLGVWINRADLPEEGDFITPSVIRRGDLCLSVSTGGNHPLLASRIAAELQARYSPDYGAFISLLGKMRAEIKNLTSDSMLRREALSALLDHETDLLTQLTIGTVEAEEKARAIVSRSLSDPLLPNSG